MSDYVTRYVVTKPCADGIGRQLFSAAQGRFTYKTPEDAQAMIDAMLKNNSEATILEHGIKDLEVRPCKCYANHFDPAQALFDMPPLEEYIDTLVAQQNAGK